MSPLRQNQASLLSFLPSGPNYWIGLADLANEGVYKWQTGYNAAEYTFWEASQPDGDDGEDCVELVCMPFHKHTYWHILRHHNSIVSI